MTPIAETIATAAPRPRQASVRHTLRRRALIALGLLGGIVLFAAVGPGDPAAIDPFARSLPPSATHLFGTDLLGRDLLARTVAALSMSVKIGLLAAGLSTGIAAALGLLAALGGWADRAVGVATELALGLPHFVLVLMVAYAAGGGATGVTVAVALTHWPRLARVLRHEAQTVAASDYVAVSRALGRSPWWIARRHLAPHLLPQLVAGFVLVFPHAILHEAGLSFIGLGMPPHLPSIGVMLADSMRALTAGAWWGALFPGLGLMLVAFVFERFGEALRRAADPAEGVA
jgi:peptide/nickel transport system permease protein